MSGLVLKGLPVRAALGVVVAMVASLWVVSLASAAGGPTGHGLGLAAGSSALDAKAAGFGTPSGSDVAGLRTATSDTWQSSNGLYTTRVFDSPINYRDSSGGWKPIDNSLVADPAAGSGAVQNQANSWKVRLPGQLGSGVVSVTEGGETVGFDAKGASASKLTVSGADGTYANAYPGADLHYSARSDLIKESIVLRSASAPSSYTFPLHLPAGITPKVLAGGVVFERADGSRLPVGIAAPTVTDASKGFQDPFAHVSMDLKQVGSSWELVVSVDKAWLGAPDRVFPVTIDPSVTTNSPQQDCWLNSAAPTTSACTTGYMDVGSSGSTKTRMMMQFNLASAGIPQDAMVSQTGLHVDFASGTAISGVQAFAMTHSWTMSATWNAYDGTNAWPYGGGGATSSTVSDSESIPAAGGWTTWYMTDLGQYWANYPSQNWGVMLRNDTAGAIRGAYNIYSTSNQSYWPYLQVSWAPHIGQPGASPMVSFPTSDGSSIEVNAANGNMELHAPLMHIAGTGVDFNLGLWMSSLMVNTGFQGGMEGQFLFNPGGGLSLYMAYGGSSSGAQYNPVIFGPDGVPRIYTPVAGQSYYTAPGIDATLSYDSTHYRWILQMDSSGLSYAFQGNVTANNYGALLYEFDRNGNTITYNWNSSGTPQLTSITDSQGRTITPTYSGGQVTKWTDSTGRSVALNVTGSQLTSWTDGAGGTTQYGYSNAGPDPTSITDPDGNLTNITYNAGNQVTQITRGPATYGFAYSTTLDSRCAHTDPYTVISQTTVTDPDGNKTIYCTDIADRTATKIDAAGNVTSYTYGDLSLDQPTSTSLPNGASSTASYQQVNGVFNANLTTSGVTASGSSYPDGSSSYNAGGGNTYLADTTTDSQGNQTAYTYDTWGNPTSVTDALSAAGPYQNTSQDKITLSYSPSHFGWLTQSTDPDGHATSYGYDSAGNLTTITPPVPMAPQSYTYDGLSRVATHTDGDGNTTAYTYDGDDRVTKTTYQDGSTVNDTYDADGQLLTETDSSGIKTNTYDSLGQLTKSVLASGQTLTYAYDPAGNLTSFTDGAGTTTYSYNNLNQLITMVEAGGNTTTFAYNALGQRITFNLPNGIVETYTYNADGQPLSMTAKNSAGTVLASETYTYTASSTNTQLIQSATDQSGNVTSYTYDPLNRLIEAKTTNGSSTVSDYKYTYDGAGNMLTAVNGASTTTMTYNSADELATYNGTAASSDAAGNLTSAAGVPLSYNAKEQTTSVGGQAFGYFGNGQNANTGFAGTSLVNSTLGVSAATTGSTTDYITRDNQGAAVGETTPSGSYYYLTDPRGTVLDVTDSAGAIVANNSYDPYGITTTGGTGPDDLGYLGSYRNSQGGTMLHFGARMYGAGVERWTQPDPLARSLVDSPTNSNPFSYSGDDPTNAADPLGTRPICGQLYDTGCFDGIPYYCQTLYNNRRRWAWCEAYQRRRYHDYHPLDGWQTGDPGPMDNHRD
jgi:RHS repeat-associated protein